MDTVRCNVKPYEGKENYIFISYSHKDKAQVFPIIEQMVKDGYRVWYDEGIDPGTEWPEFIAEHLSGCMICIAFISANSLGSKYCKREINYAVSEDRIIVSVFLEQVQMTKGMKMQLSSLQAVHKYTLRSDAEFYERLYSADNISECREAGNKTAAAQNAETKKTAPVTAQQTKPSDTQHSAGTAQPQPKNIQTAASPVPAAPSARHIEITTEGGRQYITLGAYEMERWDDDKDKAVSNGKRQPLSWEILHYSRVKKRALVLCRNIVTFKFYNEEKADVTWEKCTLRKWLNRDFYETAFSEEERKLIIPTTISNPDNEEYETEGGNDTKDRVFLLSLDEVGRYFPNNDARVRRTYDGEGWLWWLRSPGDYSDCAANVNDDGTFDGIGIDVTLDGLGGDGLGVCPAFWIDLTSEKELTERMYSAHSIAKLHGIGNDKAPAAPHIEITTEGGREYITLGSYEMERWDYDKKKAVSSGKKQPLSWEVLTYSPDKKRALVLCRNVVTAKPYNRERVDITWEKCTLRGWLNRDFYEEAFSAEERKLIMPTKISNPDNAEYGTKGGNDTEDRIFLLSIDEAVGYFPNDTARVRRTYDGDSCWWWLRSPGFISCDAANVSSYGYVAGNGSLVNYDDRGACPAFWINLTPEI